MARKAIVTSIGQGTEYIPNIPDEPMLRQKNDVTVSEPKLIGKKFYVILHYRKPGSTKRSKTRYCTGESDKRKAREAGYKLRDAFRLKLYARELSEGEKAPLGECVQEYLSQGRWAPGWERQVRAFLEKFPSPEHVYPDTSLCLVTGVQCINFFRSIGGRHNPHTAYRTLRTFFGWAVDEKNLARSPITRKMGKELKPKKVVQDYLHEELREFEKFFAKLSDDSYRLRAFKYIFYLAQATGLRLQDVCAVQESDIDSEHGIIVVQQHKTGETVRAFISPQVADAINLQQRNKATHENKFVRESGWLFAMEYRDKAGEPFAPRTVEEAFLTARREHLANRPGLHFHSLRHSFGQNAYNFTGAHDAISVAMGHGSPAVTLAHYATNARYVETPERYETLRKYLWSRPVLSRISHEIIAGQITEESLITCITQQESTTSNSN